MEMILILAAAVIGIAFGTLTWWLRPSGVAALCACVVPAAGVPAAIVFC